MNAKTDVHRITGFVCQVEIGQPCSVGNISTPASWGYRITGDTSGSSAVLCLGINVEVGRTKRDIGPRQLAHTGRVEQHGGSVFGVGSSAGVGGAHLAGALFVQRETTGHNGCWSSRSEEHTSELQSRPHLVCRLLL